MERKQEKALHYIFVYGTLKKGYRNNVMLDGQRFVEEAVTQPAYKMYENGSFPMIVEAKDGYSIRGEVWQVTDATMRRLDMLEGVPYLYDRGVIKMADLAPGVPYPHKVIGYLFQQELDGLTECGQEWKSRRRLG